MDLKEGHSEEHFNPSSKQDVGRMKNFIKKKIKEGYYLFGAKKNGDGSFSDYMVLRNEKDITDKKLERFLLAKDVHKRLISPPKTGG